MTIIKAFKHQAWKVPKSGDQLANTATELMDITNLFMPLRKQKKWGTLLKTVLEYVGDRSADRPRIPEKLWRRGRWQLAMSIRILLNADRLDNMGIGIFVNVLRSANVYDVRMCLKSLPDAYFDALLADTRDPGEHRILRLFKVGSF